MWSANLDGEVLGDTFETDVKDREHATSILVGELYESASDLFMHNALALWFTTGEVRNLSEHVNDISFWNVRLDGNEAN